LLIISYDLFAETYPRVEHLNGASHCDAPGSLADRQERLARDKHSSSLRTLANYGRKKFYNIDPRIIRIDDRRPKPTGIIWNLLSKEKFEKIPILKELQVISF